MTRYLIILLCLCMIPATLWAQPAGDIEVTGVFQLTPTGRNISQVFFGVRNHWSLNNDRIQFRDGSTNVWGFSSDLKTWANETEYLAERKAFPSKLGLYIEWSIFSGENNIVYAIDNTTRMIIKYNTDTEVITNIISYDPESPNDPNVPDNFSRVFNPYVKGWTSDNHLIVTMNAEGWTQGCYEINLQTPSRTWWADCNYPPSVKAKWPELSHGHQDTSPNWQYQVEYGSPSRVATWPAETTIISPIRNQPQWDNIGQMTHASWNASNDWWIAEDLGLTYYGQIFGGGGVPSTPHIDTYRIAQCFRSNGVCNILYEQRSAGQRDGPTLNYQAYPIPSVRKDGLAIIYQATGENYSQKDNQDFGSTPWAHPQLYLLELQAVGGAGAPTIVSIDADQITTSSARINWTVSEPATGYVEWGTTASYGSSNAPGETSFTFSTHHQIISGLSADTLYHYRVHSTDPDTNEVISADQTFTTLAEAGDTTAPTGVAITSPGSLAVVNNIIQISANATDETAMSHVEFFVSGVPIGIDFSGPEPWTQQWDTREFDNGSYDLSVLACDTAEPENCTASPEISVTVENALEFPPDATGLSDTASETVALPASATGLSDTASETVALPASATGLSDTASETVTLPSSATGLGPR